MKVLSINGSPRVDGNTAIMLRRVTASLAAGGAQIDEVSLGEVELAPCRACMVCMDVQDGRCHGYKDACNDVIERTRAADVILLGSPVYFGSVTGQIKAYMDRVGFVNRTGKPFLARKIGAAVTPARRAGKLLTFAELNMWFLINGMIVPGSTYWNVGLGMKEGEIADDTEAMETLDALADNIKWLAAATNK